MRTATTATAVPQVDPAIETAINANFGNEHEISA